MYTLIRTLSIKQIALEQIPVVGTSLVIAELFYKFHSFILECIAFFATWFAIDYILQSIINFKKKSRINKNS